MCSAYSKSSNLPGILKMLEFYCKMSDSLLKQVTTYYLSYLFPADDARSRLLLIQSHTSSVGCVIVFLKYTNRILITILYFSDTDLKKILYNVDEVGNLVGKNDNALLLPRFPDMVMTVVENSNQYDSSALLEVN